MSVPDVLSDLQRWYSEQCDGEWEHSGGVLITSLDNPGWSVRVDVGGTPSQNRPQLRIEDHRSEDDWLVLWRDEIGQRLRRTDRAGLRVLRGPA